MTIPNPFIQSATLGIASLLTGGFGLVNCDGTWWRAYGVLCAFVSSFVCLVLCQYTLSKTWSDYSKNRLMHFFHISVASYLASLSIIIVSLLQQMPEWLSYPTAVGLGLLLLRIILADEAVHSLKAQEEFEKYRRMNRNEHPTVVT